MHYDDEYYFLVEDDERRLVDRGEEYCREIDIMIDDEELGELL